MNLKEQTNRIKEMMGINKIKPKTISFYYHENLMDLFSEYHTEITEEDDERNIVVDKIINNVFTNNPQVFYDSFINMKKHQQMLTDYSLDDFQEMKVYKLNGYDIGYALKKMDTGDYEIVSVFNNSDVKNIGEELIKSAVKNGGCYLDHYDGFLSSLYSRLGFEEYKRYPYDPKYDPNGLFREKYGEQDVIFRKHKDC